MASATSSGSEPNVWHGAIRTLHSVFRLRDTIREGSTLTRSAISAVGATASEATEELNLPRPPPDATYDSRARMRVRHSRAWKIFRPLGPCSGVSMFKSCGTEILTPNASTLGMLNHVDLIHDGDDLLRKITVENFRVDGSYNDDALAKLRTRTGPINGDNFRRMLVRLIVECGMPFCSTDKAAFQELLYFLDSPIRVPSRRTVRDDIEKTYSWLLPTIMSWIKSTGRLMTYVTDCWKGNNEFWAELIGQIVVDGKICSFTLAFDKLPNTPNGLDMAVFISEVMALDIMAVASTSAACERSFSQASQMLTEFRRSMTPESVGMAMVLRSWFAEF